MITSKNIFRHELVGLPVKVVDSTHEGFIGIEGKVVDETKNTLLIEQENETEKRVPKGATTFHFNLPDGTIFEIEGKIIIARPEDRIKKKFRKYW